MINRKLNGLSLFSSAGIAEMNLSKCNIEMKVANELLPIRSKTHEFWNKNSQVICGDITNKRVRNEIITLSKKENVEFILATPPCQGVSLIGKNKTNEQMLNDDRNFLIFSAFEIFDALLPKIIVIENVARYVKMLFPYERKMLSIVEILKIKYSEKYDIYWDVYNAADYGVPQNRNRFIAILVDRKYFFEKPTKLSKKKTLRDVIYDLPSLESGEKSNLKNHYARKHNDSHILFMKHTPTGKSAFDNKIYFPKKENGERLKGYSATYKRMEWDQPAPTVTMRNDAISSQSNVHPGRKKDDGTYSDARVLTLRELFIISSINPDIDLPNFASDIQIRHMIGEAVPPLLIEVICKNIFEKEN